MPLIQVPPGVGNVTFLASDGTSRTFTVDANEQITVTAADLQAALQTSGGTVVEMSDNSGATTARPSAVGTGVGAQFYDSTLSKPIWSDGTIWRDATGTGV